VFVPLLFCTDVQNTKKLIIRCYQRKFSWRGTNSAKKKLEVPTSNSRGISFGRRLLEGSEARIAPYKNVRFQHRNLGGVSSGRRLLVETWGIQHRNLGGVSSGRRLLEGSEARIAL